MKASDKNPNRKAFPKFLLWVLRRRRWASARHRQRRSGGSGGGRVGPVRLPALLGTIAPWGIPVSSAAPAGHLPGALPLRENALRPLGRGG